MDKRMLQTYSVWAKENLEKQIEVSLKTLGINSDKDIKSARRVGDFTVIDGDANSYPAALYERRRFIADMVRSNGYRNVIEELAYTWFNRLVALRFMEVHDFLPHGFRVLSSRSGDVEPEILKNLAFVKDELGLNLSTCGAFRDSGDIEGLFRYVLLRQCNALSGILPMLFSRDSDYLELLLPQTLLTGDTVLTRLIAIPEENFLNDVEIIGWMYQFYISVKKDEVFASKKTITKDTLPAVTQLFTPDWIVRYMAENSVGRIWLESYPNSPLRGEMKYYVDDPEQTAEVQRKLDAIKYRNVNPEDIRIIEPCCGSGHILVYVFDLLYRMYEEKGYQKRDIPTLILSKNLVGLDVDKRAAQLASFSLAMKARSVNNRFFSKTYYTQPRVYEIIDSQRVENLGYRQHLKTSKVLTDEELEDFVYLVDTFRYGKVIGSLLKVKPKDYAHLSAKVDEIERTFIGDVFSNDFRDVVLPTLKKLLTLASVLSAKYDVMITNPPYMGISSMEDPVKKYAAQNYPNSKTDMFAMFMETGFVKTNGFTSMINMNAWMFISTYEKLRLSMLERTSIISMLHLGPRAFDTISGEVVQTTTFVLRNYISDFTGAFYKLVRVNDKRRAFINSENLFYSSNKVFREIPGYAFAYWISQNLLKIYHENDSMGTLASPKQGSTLGINDSFLRLWHETSKDSKRWYPCLKGGEYRKWYGNHFYLVDWENNGARIKKAGKATIRNANKLFEEGISWSRITNFPSFRIMLKGFFLESASGGCFPQKQNQFYILGLLNSKLIGVFSEIVNPTLTLQSGDVSTIPVKVERKREVEKTVSANIDISKSDWDSFETSWDFQRHPLVVSRRDFNDQMTLNCNAAARRASVSLLSSLYEKWERECQDRFDTLKANEEELNRIFIDIYGLQDELTPEVEDKDVTVRLADKERDVKSLISYLIGVIMGRYSLDEDGLAYAGGAWDASKYRTYQPDDDGIVPIYSGIGMEDGLTAQLIRLLKVVYGEDAYRANIDFIADALGKAQSESSEETLNRYLNNGFYQDHLKIYQKRPIYWMFSSGKNSGFKCLIYMHRYNADTLARINGKYFLPESTRLKNELDELLIRMRDADGREKIRLEKVRQKLAASYNEAIEYGQILDHMANKYIEIDLDDGVKVNYAKFQGVEMVSDSGTKVKKDLLVPIK